MINLEKFLPTDWHRFPALYTDHVLQEVEYSIKNTVLHITRWPITVQTRQITESIENVVYDSDD